ncbi:MAG: MarC family protein [Candidatus Mucispirillum faecigallinarum]|uniref:UPF0056 membrane protein n=1 Tax=Candidatus Mucispirillum faecigallinarum TaxID=2838699 RepID=A0A9D2KCQ7_9BACT|nr:MarC family protein [Mucispirillum sp.]MDY5051559.1 MarC family protein [Candidatus Mucispirillum faecigallinarum]HIZ90022.1 MarC family protein [Candidatus Mucispirillum faecigallinarum]
MFSNIESFIYAVFLSAIAIVAVMNPFGNLPQFIAMTDGMALKVRQHLFRNIIITAFVIVMIFLFAGPAVMEYMFRVSLDELRIAGGLILVVMGIKNLLFPGAVKDFSHYQDMSEEELIRRSIIPMAFPMLIGPGTLSTIVVMAAEGGMKNTIAGILAAFFFMSVLFYFASFLERVLGKLVLFVTARIMQVFIVAMGVKMMLIGLGVNPSH